MKDILGVEIEMGDIILACASTGGPAKFGQVYKLDKNGNPLVRYLGKKYNLKSGKYEDAWMRGAAGSHALIIQNDLGHQTDELIERLALIRETDLG